MNFSWDKDYIIKMLKICVEEKDLKTQATENDLFNLTKIIFKYQEHFTKDDLDYARGIYDEYIYFNKPKNEEKQKLDTFENFQKLIYGAFYNFPDFEIDQNLFSFQYSTDDPKIIINNFLLEINPKFSLYFNDLSLKNRLIISDKKNDHSGSGYYPIINFKESFMIVDKKENDLVYFMTLVHEIGHLIDYEFSDFKDKSQSMLFMTEVIPYLLVFLFCDYLKHKKYISNDQYNELKKYFSNEISSLSKFLKETIEVREHYNNSDAYYNIEDINFDVTIDNQCYNKDKFKSRLKTNLDYSNIRYLTNHIIAYSLYKKISNNTLKADEVICKISLNKNQEAENVFKNLGFENFTLDELEGYLIDMYDDIKEIEYDYIKNKITKSVK